MNILMGLNAPWVGGTRIHVLTLARALLQRGHCLALITDGGILEEEMRAAGIPFLERADGIDKMIRLMLGAVARDRPEIIHAHPAESILESFYISNMTGIPFIATMHGEYLMHFRRDDLGGKVAAAVSAVIAVGEQIQEYLMEHSSLPAEKIHVIPNGIDIQSFRPGLDAPHHRSLFMSGEVDKVVMYLGRLDSDKRPAIEAFVKAVDLLGAYGLKVKGVMVGSGDLLPMLRESARRMNMAFGREVLILTGFRRDTAELLSAADMVVGAGRSALEAMAVGKPVLAAGRAGCVGLMTPERWAEGRSTNFADHGNLPEPDPVNLADELFHLHSRLDRYATALARLRELVVEHYQLDRVVDQVMAVYRAVLDSA